MLRPMNGFVRKLAARLLEEEQSGNPTLTRNRHFEVFGDSQGRLALRIYRQLRSLRQDILGAASELVRLERPASEAPGRVRLRIALAGRRGVRTAYLSPDELELLLETPGVRRKLAGG